jgi:hypothetical protein
VPSVQRLVAIIGGIVGAITAIVTTTIAVLQHRARRNRATSGVADDEELLNSAASQLSRAIRKQWHEEELRRRIQDPFPLPVRWVNAPEDLFDHWANILRLKSTPPIGLDLANRLENVVDTFNRLPSKRLVFLGDAGSGKTILALRFVLDFITRRQTLDPVPVVFNLGSWDPTVTSLHDWLVRRLIEEYPGLAAPAPQHDSLARALLEDDRILPVLDGFDELAHGLRPTALSTLNSTTVPMILTSRTIEYAAAVDAADVLTAAAAVRLVPLTIDDLADYLPRTTRKSTAPDGGIVTKWDPVMARLRNDPSAPESLVIQTVLTTPLMISLARAIYSDTRDRDPMELFDIDRFPTSERIEEHLLDSFIPAVFEGSPPSGSGRDRRRRWATTNAERWLGNLAIRLDRLGTRDIAWWQLRDTVPRPVRMVLGGVVGGLTAGALLGLVWEFWVGLGVGMGFGTGVAIAREGRQPVRTRPRIRGRGKQVLEIMLGAFAGGWIGSLAGASIGFGGLALSSLSGPTKASTIPPATGVGVGLLVGLGFALAGRFTPTGGGAPPAEQGHLLFPNWLRQLLKGGALGIVAGILGSVALGLLGGLVVGTACGLSVGIVIGLETAVDIRTAASPSELLRTDRRNATALMILYGLIVWASVAFAGWKALGWAHSVAFGFCSGLMDAVGFGLGFTAWGHWLVITRGWLSITRCLPWRLSSFLADAYRRGVLRQSGASYQFRHARLQDRLVMRMNASAHAKPSQSSLESGAKS